MSDVSPEDLFYLYNSEPGFYLCDCGCEEYRHRGHKGECLFCHKCELFRKRQMHEYSVPIEDIFKSTKTARVLQDVCVHCGNNSSFDRRSNLHGWIRPPGAQTLFCDEVES